MFEYLRGKLVENQISHATIDVGGVGYKLWIAPSTIAFPVGQECTIYTSFVVRENSQALYGFADPSSRNLFETLINISGIGPKIGLCILSQFTPERFRDAIVTENITLISSVPGLGKRTAEKIILELKDKMIKMPILGERPSAPSSHQHLDAIGALVNLGFSEKAAAKAIEKVTSSNSEKMELSEMITEALRSR